MNSLNSDQETGPLCDSVKSQVGEFHPHLSDTYGRTKILL